MRLIKYRGKYTVTWHDGKQRRYSLRTSDERIAKQRFEAFKKDFYSDPTDIHGVCDKWLEEKKHLKGWPQAKTKLRTICRHLGDLKPDQISKEICQQYAEKRRFEGVVNTTIRNELVALRAAIRHAYPRTNAMFEMPKANPPRDRYLTRKEFKILVDAADIYHVRLFILVALYTAGRASAILELTWDRVDFSRGLIHLATGDHGNKGRATIPISDKLLPHLKEAYRGRTCDHVISYKDKPVLRVTKGFKKIVEKSGLKGVTPHVLRHTAAVWMAEGGVSMSEIAQFLGHQNSNITERVYARYSPDYLRAAGSVL